MDEQARGLQKLMDFFVVADNGAQPAKVAAAAGGASPAPKPVAPRGNTSASSAPARSAPKAASSGGDSEWEEF